MPASDCRHLHHPCLVNRWGVQASTRSTTVQNNRSVEDLITLLRSTGVETLVDVRARSFSRRYPQCNEPVLRASLDAAGIRRHRAGCRPGGMRPRPRLRAPRSGRLGATPILESEVFARPREATRPRGRALAGRHDVRRTRTPGTPPLPRRGSGWCGVGVEHLVGPGDRHPHAATGSTPRTRPPSSAIATRRAALLRAGRRSCRKYAADSRPQERS